LQTGWLVLSEELCILASFFLSPMRRNPVLEELTQQTKFIRLWQPKAALGQITPPHFVTSHSGQLNLIPSAGRKMITGQTAVTLYGCG